MKNHTVERPVALNNIDFVIWGDGSPAWDDPRNVCIRNFSRHIIWLCRQEPMTAKQIAAKLNVPAVYVEEELEILATGKNGNYGLLRRLDDGKYVINFILLDKKTMSKAHYIYITRILAISDVIEKFVQENRERFMEFPYLNHRVDWNLILWQQIIPMSRMFSAKITQLLTKKYFSHISQPERPFNVYGYEYDGVYYGGGWDSIHAKNICGYAEAHLDNIYNKHIKIHFYCDHNAANDPEIQLAIQAINGIDIKILSDQDREHAAKAVECGYLYREGDILYTKILVNNVSDTDRLFEISNELAKDYFDASAEKAAADIAKLIYENVPKHLLGEWQFANELAGMPILDSLADILIDKGILIPPKDGIGAEGCWMSVG